MSERLFSVSDAVQHLTSKVFSNSSWDQKIDFLESRGLSLQEIKEVIRQLGNKSSSSSSNAQLHSMTNIIVDYLLPSIFTLGAGLMVYRLTNPDISAVSTKCFFYPLSDVYFVACRKVMYLHQTVSRLRFTMIFLDLQSRSIITRTKLLLRIAESIPKLQRPKHFRMAVIRSQMD